MHGTALFLAISAFVMGSERGSYDYDDYATTVDIADPDVLALGSRRFQATPLPAGSPGPVALLAVSAMVGRLGSTSWRGWSLTKSAMRWASSTAWTGTM